jgi:hypothetical protein
MVTTLFYFCFFINNVLAHPRIILFNLDLLRVKTFVFGRGVKVTGSCTGNQSDFIAHREAPEKSVVTGLKLFAFCSQVGNDFFNAQFIDDSQSFGRNTQFHVTFLALEPESVRVKIG